jgi:hypothetical protein
MTILTKITQLIQIKTEKVEPIPLNPCDNGIGCIGGFVNNQRYTTGSGSKIASAIIIDLAQALTYLCGSVAVIFIVWAGVKMLTADGDSSKFEGGLKTIRYAIIGLVISVLAYGLVAVIANFLTNFNA